MPQPASMVSQRKYMLAPNRCRSLVWLETFVAVLGNWSESFAKDIIHALILKRNSYRRVP